MQFGLFERHAEAFALLSAPLAKVQKQKETLQRNETAPLPL